ncbi:MAG: tetratricopeptide repeat protein [Nitrospirae bacterium]|jgi:TolA-binding protein|nr:tetratricopeptide repeat protein [Nitrospirota bacterium]
MKSFIISLIITVSFIGSVAFADVANYEEALLLYKKGDYKTAAGQLKEYLKEKPDPYAYYLLGYAYYKMKKYPDSVKYFKEAYTIDPDISPASIE